MLRLICAVVLGMGMIPTSATAQTSPQSDEYSVITAAEPPLVEAGNEYRRIARRARAQIDVTYAQELKGSLSGTPAKSEPKRAATRSRRSGGDLNGFGAVFGILLVLGLLILVMKFGAGGTLLAREPRETTPQAQAPDAWKMSHSGAPQDLSSLLSQIAAMSDRSAAMVLLLRHCLLAGANSTQARFARSDTERRAFARLPDNWSHHTALEAMLRQAELAHYGGRPVSDDRFAGAIATARLILGGRA